MVCIMDSYVRVVSGARRGRQTSGFVSWIPIMDSYHVFLSWIRILDSYDPFEDLSNSSDVYGTSISTILVSEAYPRVYLIYRRTSIENIENQ